MKALEILRWSQDKAPNNYLDFLCGEEWDNLIKEAIKELEKLIAKDKSKNCEERYNKTKLAIKALENRSCSNCKHWELGWCFKLGSSLDIGGCGDYWEQK